MRKLLPMIVPVLALLVYAPIIVPRTALKSHETESAKLSAAQVHSEYARLEKLLVPPENTPLSEIEAVYGKLENQQPNADVADGESHTLTTYLLPPVKRGIWGSEYSFYGARLWVHARHGKSFNNSLMIQYEGEMNNLRQRGVAIDRFRRRQELKGAALAAAEAADAASAKRAAVVYERQRVAGMRKRLNEMLKIQQLYGDRLRNAPWNRA